MATSIDFPASLPAPQQGSFRESAKDPWVDDGSSVGSFRRRARFTRALRRFSFATLLSVTQKVTLETFYDTTLSAGVSSFNWIHPITLVSYEVVFSERPSLNHFDGDYYRVGMSMEVI